MQAEPFLIDGWAVRSLLIFSLSQSATPAIKRLQQQPVQATLASALIGSIENLSMVEMKAAIALLKAKEFEASIIFTSAQRSPYKAAYPLLFSRHTLKNLSVV